MPPKKKAKADAPRGKVGDFLKLLDELVLHYTDEDDRKADSFQTAMINISFWIEHNPDGWDTSSLITESDADMFLKVKGVGKSTVELIKEFIRTGTMERVENFRKVQTCCPEALKPFSDRLKGYINEAKVKPESRDMFVFVALLDELVIHYRKAGDAGRAKSFESASLKLNGLRSSDDDTPLTESDADEFLKVKGVGKTTVELMKEFIKTGTFERLENFRKVQKLPSEAFLSDLKKLGRIDKKFKTMKLKMYPDEDEKPDEWWDVEVQCAYSEYTAMEVFEEEEEYWEDIEKVKAKIKNDVYQQDQVWEGVVSKGDTRGTFKFIHHRDHDGDVELEGDLPEDCDGETLEEFLTEKLIHDCDSGDESCEGSEGEPDESYEGSEGE
jgi:DNA polymerase/3'-5' exonuclease PolX